MHRIHKQLGVAFVALLLLVGLISPALAANTGDGSEANPYTLQDNITICHRTNSQSNPYVVINPNIQSWLSAGHVDHAEDAWLEFWYLDANDVKVFVPERNVAQFTACLGLDPLDEAFPVAPTLNDATCGANGSLVVTEKTGVVYSVNGTEYPSGTTITTPGEYTVTAAPAQGYYFDAAAGPWVRTVAAQLTGSQCDTPPPPPGPQASANLLAGGICPIDVYLIDYLVEGAEWTSGTLSVLAEDAVVASYEVTPGSLGTLDWPLDGDGLPYASVSLSLEAGGLVRTAGPIDLDDSCGEVADEVEDDVTTLPETGIPALALSLLGLFGMASGGALLRRTR
jgi:LPXTG-motif cell wall-anchored protein